MALNLSLEAAAFLREYHVMTLATQGPEGPWAAAVFYAIDGDDLVFLSSPSSRHASDLAREPRCAATIQGQERDWRSIQGLQVEGLAMPIEAPRLEQAQREYAERFAFVRPGSAPAAIAQALARIRWYRLRPHRVLFIDNARGFGHRQEFLRVPGRASPGAGGS